MQCHKIITSLMFLCIFFLVIFFGTVSTSDQGIGLSPAAVLAKDQKEGGGPPSHAQAHGYRAKYSYRYYPTAGAYYDVQRKVYFYLEGSNWQMSVSLPSALKVQLGDSVSIEMDSDKPYTQFEQHKRTYPATRLHKTSVKKN